MDPFFFAALQWPEVVLVLSMALFGLLLIGLVVYIAVRLGRRK